MYNKLYGLGHKILFLFSCTITYLAELIQFLLFQNSDFGLKLIDFGLARNLSDGQGVKIEALQGTLGW